VRNIGGPALPGPIEGMDVAPKSDKAIVTRPLNLQSQPSRIQYVDYIQYSRSLTQVQKTFSTFHIDLNIVCPSRSFAALGISRQNVSENSLAPLPMNQYKDSN
jgi:hypothetical protein